MSESQKHRNLILLLNVFTMLLFNKNKKCHKHNVSVYTLYKRKFLRTKWFLVTFPVFLVRLNKT